MTSTTMPDTTFGTFCLPGPTEGRNHRRHDRDRNPGQWAGS